MTLRHRAAVLVIVLSPAIDLLGHATSALAQAGYYVSPSLSVTESYDDNVFLRSSKREDDYISRFLPGLRAGYQSVPFTLLGNYSFRSALYALHPELDAPTESQSGGLELKYRPTEVLSLGFNGYYSETEIPSELNQPNPALPGQATTSILTPRQTSSVYSLVPSIEYRLNPLTRSSATYIYSVAETGTLSTTSQAATLELDRDVTRQDTGTLKSDFRDFETNGSTASSNQPSSITSYAFTVGWMRRFTERLDAKLQAGPRFTEGAVDAEVSANINWRFELGTASLGYSRTETTAVGVGGAFQSDSVFASVAVEPIRFLHLSLSPRWVQNTPEGAGAQAAGQTTVYAVDAAATYQLTRWLTARLGYQFASQHQGGSQDILHNVVTIGLDFVYPTRVY